MEELGYLWSDHDGIGFVQSNWDYFKDFSGSSGIWPKLEKFGYLLSDRDGIGFVQFKFDSFKDSSESSGV